MELDLTSSEDGSVSSEETSDSEMLEEAAPAGSDAPASSPEGGSESSESENTSDSEEVKEPEPGEKEKDLSSSPTVESDLESQETVPLEHPGISEEDLSSDPAFTDDISEEYPEESFSEEELSLSVEGSQDADLYVLVLEGFQVTNELMMIQIGLLALLFAMFVFRFVYRLISNMVTKL